MPPDRPGRAANCEPVGRRDGDATKRKRRGVGIRPASGIGVSVSALQELSGCRDRRPPRGHRRSAKHAVRVGTAHSGPSSRSPSPSRQRRMMQKGSVEAYEPALRRPRRERISAPGVAPDVLLSFAQFEREVTGERIRTRSPLRRRRGCGWAAWFRWAIGSKIALSHIVDDHAAIVRSLFQRYLEAGSVVCLKQSLDAEGLRIPIRIDRAGRSTGGGLFSRGHVYKLLSNPIYVGRIAHKGQVHEGQHPPIVDQDLWDRVQQSLRDHLAASGTKRTCQSSEALLAELSADRRASQTDIRDRIDRVAISGTAIQIRLRRLERETTA